MSTWSSGNFSILPIVQVIKTSIALNNLTIGDEESSSDELPWVLPVDVCVDAQGRCSI